MRRGRPGSTGLPVLLLGLLLVLATSSALPCPDGHAAVTSALGQTLAPDTAHPCGGDSHCTAVARDGRSATPDTVPTPPSVVAAGPAAETVLAVAAPSPAAAADPVRADGRQTYLTTLRLRL